MPFKDILFDKRTVPSVFLPDNFIADLLIESGGGKGPAKPQQPVHKDVRC
jgi:hypothetical protein